MKARALLVLALTAGSVTLVSPEFAGAVAPKCFGFTATKVGTPGRDVLIGTVRRDVIVAQGGNDAILGRAGHDVICAGKGSDLIDGMSGNDRVSGGIGSDACNAPTAAEHRLHVSCEIHMQPPPPPGQSTSAAPTAAPGGATMAGRTLTMEGASSPIRAPVGTNPTPGRPTCGPGRITLHQVSVSGAYTDPAFVRVRPYYFRWGTGGWSFAGYNDWIQINNVGLPPDFTIVLLEDTLTAARGYWYIGYEWQWWNGANWTDQTYTPVETYRTFFGPFPLNYSYCITV